MPTVAQKLATDALAKLGLASSSRVFWPVPGGRISQRPSPGHEALDIAAALGTKVFLPVGGRVTSIRNSQTGFGLNVRVLTPQGIEEVFGHLSEEDVTLGDVLRPGALIGRVGSSGFSSGPHLHFETRRPGRDVFLGQHSTTTAIDPYTLLGFSQSLPPIVQVGKQNMKTVQKTPTTKTPNIGTPSTSSLLGISSGPAPAVSVTAGGKTVTASARPSDAKDAFVLSSTPLGDITVPKSIVERGGLSLAGYALIIIGIIGLIISYRAEIATATTQVASVAKVAALYKE